MELGLFVSFNSHKPKIELPTPFLQIILKTEHSLVIRRSWGWSGGAMALVNLPVPGRPTIWITVGQGPTALEVGAGGVV